MKRTLFGFLFAALLACAIPAVPEAQVAGATQYVACSGALALAAAGDMLSLESGPDHGVQVLKIWIVPGSQTAAGYHQILVRRTNSASTGGTTFAPAPIDVNAIAFTGITRYGGTGGGNPTVTLFSGAFFAGTTTTTGGAQDYVIYDATGVPGGAILVSKGVANGLKITDSTGGAGGANHYACVLFVEGVE